MLVRSLSEKLGCPLSPGLQGLEAFNELRTLCYRPLTQSLLSYLSKSENDSPVRQAVDSQVRWETTSYVRYNAYTLDRETAFNAGHSSIDGVEPRTLFFGSGMAAASVSIHGFNAVVDSRRAYVGKSTYFEVQRLLRCSFKVSLFAEHNFDPPEGTQLFWWDDPTSDAPTRTVDSKAILAKIIERCQASFDREHYVVIDYTICGSTFDVRHYISELPLNLHILLLTSLQKFATYGLDIATGGAVTIYSRYSDLYDRLRNLRPHCGASFTEKALYVMPKIDHQLVSNIVVDAGRNAAAFVSALSSLDLSTIRVHYETGLGRPYSSSLVFLEVLDGGSHIGRSPPYPAGKLISSIVGEARRRTAPIVHGESFGFPNTRMYRYRGTIREDVRFIRFAVGWDEELAQEALPAILDGIRRYTETNEDSRQEAVDVRDSHNRYDAWPIW